MRYIGDRLNAYAHPRSILDNARTIIVLGTPYKASWGVGKKSEIRRLFGRVASYAQADRDYHDTLHERMKKLIVGLQQEVGLGSYRGVVDTAPLMEREAAQLAGLGWIGKNTLLLNQKYGSYFFLSAILSDRDIEPDEPMMTDHCGTCTACLDACPTNAFPQPYVLDARRCLSYLTIEHREAVDPVLRPHVEEWIFGCDICQEVCPWNRRPSASTDIELSPKEEHRELSLRELLSMDEATFRRAYRNRPLGRPKWTGMIRNAIYIAVGQDAVELLPELKNLLISENPPLVRETAEWAIDKLSRCQAAAEPQERN